MKAMGSFSIAFSVAGAMISLFAGGSGNPYDDPKVMAVINEMRRMNEKSLAQLDYLATLIIKIEAVPDFNKLKSFNYAM